MKFIQVKRLALGALLLAAMNAQAKPEYGRGHGPANPEVRAYYQANVQPVVRQQRQKLEAQLSAADKTQLAAYRAQLKELRQRGHSLRAAMRPNAEGSRPNPTDAQKQQFEQLHADQKAVLGKVKELATKYETSIKQLAAEVAPQRKKWATDMKALASKNAAQEQNADAQRMGRRGQHVGMHGRVGHAFGPVRFLLMDPNAPVSTKADLEGSSVYPNPVAPTSQLEYSVKKAGPVNIELLDSKGNKLRTLLQDANQEKGTHTQALQLSDLPNGTYYYKITTRSGSETKRFVKE